MDLPSLAKRLGLEPRTLKRIRSGEFKLSEPTKRHLLDLERMAELETAAVPTLGNVAKKRKSDTPAPSRMVGESGVFGCGADEAMRLVLARVTSKASIHDLAQMISLIADDPDLPSGLRNRVVKTLSDLIPGRMP